MSLNVFMAALFEQPIASLLPLLSGLTAAVIAGLFGLLTQVHVVRLLHRILSLLSLEMKHKSG
jgi:hypothetical protein